MTMPVISATSEARRGTVTCEIAFMVGTHAAPKTAATNSQGPTTAGGCGGPRETAAPMHASRSDYGPLSPGRIAELRS